MMLMRAVGYAVAAALGYWLTDWITASLIIAGAVLAEVLLSRIPSGRIIGYLLCIGGLLALVGLLVIGGVIPGNAAPMFLIVAVVLGAGLAGRLPERMWTATVPAQYTDDMPCTKILDASILMDGRIADIVEIGFMDGTIVVPRFVVEQIHQVHKSGNQLKQQRAEHALDLIRRFQNMKNIRFRICELDFPEEKDIDHRIIALARKLKAKIVTNDYTLNRVASLKELEVLNINELANALKPVALPGETIAIQLIKKGKEPEQAIGYLDDGTMVVIDGGEPFIGNRVEAHITSILQNPSGKMIFGRVLPPDETRE